MNYLKESEKILENYRKLYTALANLKERQEKLVRSGMPGEVKAIDYSKPAIQHQAYSKDTINQLCEVATVSNEIKETKKEMKLVSKILKQIKKEDEILYKFLAIKFIKKPKISMKKIAEELGYSPDSNDTIYKIKERALTEFSILYFGVNATRGI